MSYIVFKPKYKQVGYLNFYIDKDGNMVMGQSSGQNYTVRVYVARRTGKVLYLSIDKSGKPSKNELFSHYPLLQRKAK